MQALQPLAGSLIHLNASQNLITVLPIDHGLAKISFLEKALGGFNVIIPTSDDDTDGNKHTPIFQMANGPSQCQFQPGFSQRLVPDNAWPDSWSAVTFDAPSAYLKATLPTMQYKCSCSAGYTADRSHACQRIPQHWTAARVACLAVGTVLATLLVTLLISTFLKRHRRLRYSYEVQQGLLESS